MSYKLSNVAYETRSFWVLAVGAKGYEVYRKGGTASTRVASIGKGPPPQLGLQRAKSECDSLQASEDIEFDGQAYGGFV